MNKGGRTGISTDQWLESLTLPYEDVPEGPEGPITGATVLVAHGVGSAVTVTVLGSAGYRVHIAPYVTGACKIIENETGKPATYLVSQFSDETGQQGIEIVVVAKPDEPSRDRTPPVSQ
jgi:predicted alpha/beta hydrolase family esterase